jgi:hypothetical protein
VCVPLCVCACVYACVCKCICASPLPSAHSRRQSYLPPTSTLENIPPPIHPSTPLPKQNKQTTRLPPTHPPTHPSPFPPSPTKPTNPTTRPTNTQDPAFEAPALTDRIFDITVISGQRWLLFADPPITLEWTRDGRMAALESYTGADALLFMWM